MEVKVTLSLARPPTSVTWDILQTSTRRSSQYTPFHSTLSSSCHGVLQIEATDLCPRKEGRRELGLSQGVIDMGVKFTGVKNSLVGGA